MMRKNPDYELYNAYNYAILMDIVKLDGSRLESSSSITDMAMVKGGNSSAFWNLHG